MTTKVGEFAGTAKYMKVVGDNSKSFRFNFPSLAAMLDHAEDSVTVYNGDRWGSQQVERGWGEDNLNGDWHGTKTFKDAVKEAHGWHDGVKMITELSNAIVPPGARARREVRMREVGPGTLSMGAFLMGHPAPYATFIDGRMGNGRGKVVRILVNCTYSAGNEQKAIMGRGAAIASLVDLLERSGKRCEITGVVAVSASSWGGSGTGEDKLIAYTRLKRAEDKLNLPVLAFAIGHPSYLRRIGFAIMESAGPVAHDTYGIGPGGGGYGVPCDPPDEEIPDNAIYLGRMMYGEKQWIDERSARLWIVKQLEHQGVKVKGLD